MKIIILLVTQWPEVLAISLWALIKSLFICFVSDDVSEAYNLIKDLEPTTPQEYILKGVVNASIGQEQGSVSLVGSILVTFWAVNQLISSSR